jgi:hypothetical protein
MRNAGYRASATLLALICLFPGAPPGIPAAHAADIQYTLELPGHQKLLKTMTDNNFRPRPFSSDGCSGGLSTAWQTVSELFPAFAVTHEKRPPWEACCERHDRVYHVAGGARSPEAGFQARLAADGALRQCVIETGKRRAPALSKRYGVTGEQIDRAYETVADAMFKAVRVGGAPCTGLPWRWGYGYPGC